MFSLSSLQKQMESVIVSHATQFSEALKTVRSDQHIDLQDWFQSVTFDTICEICFGEDPGALEFSLKGQKLAFLSAFDEAQCTLAMRNTLVNFSPFFCGFCVQTHNIQPPVWWKTMRMFNLGSEGSVKKCIKLVRDHVQGVVDRRKLSKDSHLRADILSLYLTFSKSLELPYIGKDEYLKDVSLNFILAGRDTTSCTLTNWMKLVSMHPEVESRLVEEFDSVLGSDMPTTDLMRKCVYADAVFNEVLRLYPPVPLDFRICNQAETLPSGIKVAPGDKVGITNISISRDPKYWSNPDEFIPERWLVEGKDRVRRPDEFLFPVFWSGNRLCLGKDLARLEVKMFAAILHRQFTFTVSPHREMFVNGPVMFYQDGLWSTVRRKPCPPPA